MKTSRNLRFRLKLQNSTFIVLFLLAIGLLAFLSHRYSYVADWTASQRNTLSQASRQLLSGLSQMPVITVYATDDQQIRKPINELLQRYLRARPDIAVNYVNPELEPDRVRELGITSNGELVIELDGRQQQVSRPSEQNITNAIQRLARDADRWLLFIEGHGERKAQGVANYDLGNWTKQLQAKGIKVRQYNVAETPVIPHNAAAIVIASPQLDYLPGEVSAIQEYVKNGGNLLWLAEPGSLYRLDSLAEQLALHFQPGTIVDPDVHALGINDPRFAVVSQYPQQGITMDFNAVTLFPKARGMELKQTDQWQRSVILQSSPRSWSETGAFSAQQMDPASDIPGPLVFGVAQTRSINQTPSDDDTNTVSQEQRVVVIGDGDFLSNTYLGNGGNLRLGLNLVNWLSHDERFISIPVKTAPDLNIQLTRGETAAIAAGFLLLIPLLLGVAGATVWVRRRKR